MSSVDSEKLTMNVCKKNKNKRKRGSKEICNSGCPSGVSNPGQSTTIWLIK